MLISDNLNSEPGGWSPLEKNRKGKQGGVSPEVGTS